MKKRTKNALRTLAAFLLLAAMLLSLAACSNNDGAPLGNGTNGTPSGNDSNGTPSGNDNNGGKSDDGSPSASGPAGKNTDNSFSMLATWTTTGLINHYDTTTSCDVFAYLVVEGLWGYVRSTDELYCQLASEMPVHEKRNMDDYKDVMGEDVYDFFKENGINEVTVTTGKIRPEGKWANGDEFTAKDVWAYYYIVHPTTSNHVAAVKVVDDKTVEFIWNPLKEPVDQVKNLLLASDRCATVKYDVFAEYADAAYNLVMEGAVNKEVSNWGSFSRTVSTEQSEVLGKIRQDFYACNPDWYISTGPFMLDTFSETQLLLKKNPYHWAADKIGFDMVKLYSAKDTNQKYQMLTDGIIDYVDGTAPKELADEIIAQNPDVVFLKMYNPGTFGIHFNQKNPLFSDIRVRQAFQYILNREEVRDAYQSAAVVHYLPVIGMPPSEASIYMSEKHYNALPTYSYDPDKAAQMLTELGWEKKDGSWYANGELVELNLAGPADATSWISTGEAVGAQLNAFGIKTNVLLPSNLVAQAQAEDSPYDLVLQFGELNMSFSYPTGSYSQFSSFMSKYEQLPRKGSYPDLVFNGLDGDTNTYAFGDWFNQFYYLDEDELTYMVDVFNTGIANECVGIMLFQNITGSFYNVAKISGVPLQSAWETEPNIPFVPEVGEEGFLEVARTNLNFAKHYVFSYGIFQPNKAE